MTPEQAKSLTEHLAERVCGWTIETISGEKCWVDARGRRRFAFEFAPITDPRDTALVMEAWNTAAKEMTLATDSNESGLWHAWAEDGETLKGGQYDGKSWTESVCVAICWASGWEGDK